jgi:hypothetical protein
MEAVNTQERLAPGSTIAEFRVESVLRGGEEVAVYLAEQAPLSRAVALVVSSAPADSVAAARFTETARRLAAFEHPQVLPVYDVGRAAGVTFAATAVAPGRSLEELVRERALTPSQSAEMSDRLGDALDALRRADIGPVEPSLRDVFVSGTSDIHIAALEALTASTTTGAVQSAAGVLRDLAAREDDVPPSFRRRWAGFVVGAAAVAAASVAAVVILVGGGDDERPPAVARHAPPDAPGARLVATIPLNGTPGSMAVGEEGVWVATLEGNVLRIDPRTNGVIGAPIRFAPNDRRNNVTIRTGAGAVFALDGNRGRIARVDPESGRVTVRRTLGGIVSGATVADGIVWVLHWRMLGRRAIDELVRLDAATLRHIGRAAPIGHPVRIGPQATDVEVADGVAWVTNGVEGTVMRFDSATGQSRTIRLGVGVADSALLDGTLWVPDAWSGALTPVEARTMRLPGASLHPDYPFTAAAGSGALWVIAQTGNAGPGGPERLYRVDPRSRAIVGRPVDLGSDLGWVAVGANAIWVRSPAKRAVMRFAATSPAPREQRAAPAERTPRPMLTGPLLPGTWATSKFKVPLTLSVADRGWVAVADDPTTISIARVDEPETALNVYAPAQAFTPAGEVRRLRSPQQAIDLLAANPHVRVSGRTETSLGGVPATQVDVRVRPFRSFPRFCRAACVVLWGMPASSAGVEADLHSRLWFLRHRGRTVVVSAEVDARRPDIGPSAALVSSLRFL